MPVYSIVIYLKKGRTIVEPPYIQVLPWGAEVQRFNYRVIKLWEISTEALFDSGFDGLLPLVSLTSDGLHHEAIEQVITRLNPESGTPKVDALSLTYILASLEYTSLSDLLWLRRRFAMIDDILKESWVYKEWQQEAEERVMKQTIVALVQARFPLLTKLTEKRLELLKTPQQLQQLLIQLAQARDEEEAQQVFLIKGNEQQ